MIKVRIHSSRFEILFWVVIFWVMKILQHIRDRWVAFAYFIQPKIRLHLFFVICLSVLGLGLGFAIGYYRVNLRGW
jgi:hypothetical protein